MTDRRQFEAMLEALINEDQETAKELFHNIVVAKSREIYEELLESDFPPAKDGEGDEEKDSDIGGDATDSFEDEIESDEDEAEDDAEAIEKDTEHTEEDEGDVEDRVQDLEDALEDLKAEFEHMLAGEEHEEETGIAGDHNGELDSIEGDMGDEGDMGGEGDEMEDESMGSKTIHHVHHNAEDVGMPYESIDSDEQLIREYVEKVGMNWDTEATSKEGQHVGAQAGSVTGSTNVRSTVNGSMVNDMGGTTANIAQTHVEVHGDAGMKSTVKGPGVIAPNVVPNPDAKGNINVPGGKAGKTGFKTQVKDGNWESKKTSQDGKAVGAQSGSVTGSTNVKSTVNGTVGGLRKK